MQLRPQTQVIAGLARCWSTGFRLPTATAIARRPSAATRDSLNASVCSSCMTKSLP